jgi:hypothetical protein
VKKKCFEGQSFEECEFKFTLANLPTNGAYVFDVELATYYEENDRIKIQRRKVRN